MATLASSDLALPRPFRAQRYPFVRAIVDGDERRSLAQVVSEQLLTQIIRGELPAGTRLKTTVLAQQLGVSRTPVAKALAELSADGILSQRNHYQAVVKEGASDWLLQIHELRQLLEPVAAFRAAGKLPEVVLGELWNLCHDAKPRRDDAWCEAAQYFDFGLHYSIGEFCGNLAMRESIRRCWSYKRLSYRLSQRSPAQLKPEYKQHAAILGALARGDGARAQQAMVEHLQSASRLSRDDTVV